MYHLLKQALSLSVTIVYMRQNSKTKILAIVGLTGSGKTTAVEHFTAKDYPKVYFGGVILQAMKDQGIEINPENERVFREEFREKNGKDAVVKEIIQQIKDLVEAGQHRIIADGLYTWSEYKALKRAFPGELTVVATVTPRKSRYQRLSRRPVRPLTEEEARVRDWAEIENLEKGGPIAIADHYVINDGNLESFHNKLNEITTEIDF